jgi:spore coat protein CotF
MVMQEKEIVLDVLGGAKSSLAHYATFITETANPTLRQTFQQMRDGDEKFQYDLYKIAEQKGYYVCSPNASQQDLSSIKSSLSTGAMV